MEVIYIVTLIANELLSRKLILIANLVTNLLYNCYVDYMEMIRSFLLTESLICLMVEFNTSHTTYGVNNKYINIKYTSSFCHC